MKTKRPIYQEDQQVNRSLASKMVIVKCWTFLQVQGEKEGCSLWKVLLKFMAIQACHLQKKRKVSLTGLFNTVLTYSTTKELTEMSKGSKEINEKVVPSLANVAVKEFEKSVDNVNRSVMILYRGGLMSKAKYNSVLSSLMYKTGVDSKKERCRLSNGVLLPKLLPLKTLCSSSSP